MKYCRKNVPSRSVYSSYSDLIFDKRDKELIIDNTGFNIASYFQVLNALSFNESSNICLIVPDPVTKNTVLRILSNYNDNFPEILNHLQWDVVEGAPKYDYIVATAIKSYTKREISLFREKTKKKLIFINDIETNKRFIKPNKFYSRMRMKSKFE